MGRVKDSSSHNDWEIPAKTWVGFIRDVSTKAQESLKSKDLLFPKAARGDL